jgi:hypothetical protein
MLSDIIMNVVTICLSGERKRNDVCCTRMIESIIQLLASINVKNVVDIIYSTIDRSDRSYPNVYVLRNCMAILSLMVRYYNNATEADNNSKFDNLRTALKNIHF